MPFLRHKLRPPTGAELRGEPWSTTLTDPDAGEVILTGYLRDEPEANELVLIIHGLGGTPDSYYCQLGAATAHRADMSSLSLALRGADRLGQDFYNIALVADLKAALASPECARFERIYIMGYSMGGYVSLHYACEPDADPRVRGVAAICTPLDLKSAQLHIDSRRAWAYRTHVLSGLKAIYTAVAEQRPVPSPVEDVRRVRTMWDWDALAIAPRYGYDSPEHYYDELGLGRRLHELHVPSVLVAAENDPVIPPETIRPFLPAGDVPFEVHWIPSGGHLAFPGNLELGSGAGRGDSDEQVLRWFRRQE